MNHNVFNSFSLVGNVAKVNEIKKQSNGTKFRYFTICQNTKYKDKNGRRFKINGRYIWLDWFRN